MAWTTPRTWTTGELVTAAILNTHVRDNLAYLYDRTHTVKMVVLPHVDQTGAKFRTAQGVILPGSVSGPLYYSGFRVPTDYVSGLKVTPIIVGPLSGSANNIVLHAQVYFGATAEAYTNTLQNPGNVTVATPANNTYLLATTLAITLTSPADGDYVNMEFYRDYAAGADTFTGDIYFYGWEVEYVAYR